MSLELLLCKDYSFEADIWALGCIVYELCTGKTLFDQKTETLQAEAIKNLVIPNLEDCSVDLN
jgi:serine/threonine protein kinase